MGLVDWMEPPESDRAMFTPVELTPVNVGDVFLLRFSFLVVHLKSIERTRF